MKSYTTYECEITGKTFLDRDKCRRHENKAKRDMVNEQVRIANKNKIEQSFAEGLIDPSEEFVKKWIEEWNKRNNNVNLEITLVNLRYSPSASNSHCAPRGKQTNWSGKDKDLPRGYPGFTGRIEGRFVEPIRKWKRWSNRLDRLDSFYDLCDTTHGFSSSADVFQMKGLHAGTGGGGLDSFGYGVTLFVDDFPSLKRYVLKQELKR